MLMEQMMDFTNLTSVFMLAAVDPVNLGFNALMMAISLGRGSRASRRQRKLMEAEDRKQAKREKEAHGYVDKEYHNLGVDERALGEAVLKSLGGAGAGASTASTNNTVRGVMNQQARFSAARESGSARAHRDVLGQFNFRNDWTGYAAEEGERTANFISMAKGLYDGTKTTDTTVDPPATESAPGVGSDPGGYVGDRPSVNAAGDITGGVKGIPTTVRGGVVAQKAAKRAKRLKDIADNGGVRPDEVVKDKPLEGSEKTLMGVTYRYMNGRWVEVSLDNEFDEAGV